MVHANAFFKYNKAMNTVSKTRRGAASIYVVIFTAMLLSIIVLSFVRIMINEANRTLNYSLSQSAYNSAMAGVEDAKVVLLKYQACQSTNADINPAECARIKQAFEKPGAANNCDIVREALNRPVGDNANETIISSSESKNSSIETTSRAMDQAYTCVKISKANSDYLTKLNPAHPSKLIPLRVPDTDEQGVGDQISKLNRITVSWFSNEDVSKLTDNGAKDIPGDFSLNSLHFNNTLTRHNQSDLNSDHNRLDHIGAGGIPGTVPIPPILRVELFQTAKEFSLAQFYSARPGNPPSTNRGSLLLRPSTPVGGMPEAKFTHIANTMDDGFAASAFKNFNTPRDIFCNKIEAGTSIDLAYACRADIVLPQPISSGYGKIFDSFQTTKIESSGRNASTAFLRVSLPYQSPETSVGVQLFRCENDNAPVTDTGACKSMQFAGVQSVVDSTGRANDLFRRVEVRLEMIDTSYPMPENALSIAGGKGDSSLIKDFWVTENCFSQNAVWEDNTVKTTTLTSENNGCRDNGGQNRSNTNIGKKTQE